MSLLKGQKKLGVDKVSVNEPLLVKDTETHPYSATIYLVQNQKRFFELFAYFVRADISHDVETR